MTLTSLNGDIKKVIIWKGSVHESVHMVISASWDIESNVEKISKWISPPLQLHEFVFIADSKCLKCFPTCIIVGSARSAQLFAVSRCYGVRITESKVILLADSHP